VQDLADRLTAGGASASSVQNCLDPLRVIFGRALRRDLIAVDPTEGLELRRPRGRRDRIAAPEEAAALLAALPDAERALWATAFHVGLRRGELRGLQWADVDLEAREIRVRRGWDDEEGEISGKSDAAMRTVPIIDVLAPELAAHELRTGRRRDELVFGRTAELPFVPSTVRNRARAAWTAAELDPIGLHEARHTFASTMIAAGVNMKALSEFMGHASIKMTMDVYGHLMPGGIAEARERIDSYLGRQRGDRALRAVR
jgi:integrase